MKKVVFALATALAVGVVFTGVAVSGNGGEVVDRGFACALLDGNGNAFVTNDSTLTVYQTKAVLRCSGNGAPAEKLTYFDYEGTGLTCGSAYGSTTDWIDKVGKAGNSQLTCNFALNGEEGAARGGNGLG
jgi:hypothetical protein